MQFEEILVRLADANVRFVVIEGVAIIAHNSAYQTATSTFATNIHKKTARSWCLPLNL